MSNEHKVFNDLNEIKVIKETSERNEISEKKVIHEPLDLSDLNE